MLALSTFTQWDKPNIGSWFVALLWAVQLSCLTCNQQWEFQIFFSRVSNRKKEKHKYSSRGILNRNNHSWLINVRPNLFSRWTGRSNDLCITWITRSQFSLVICYWSAFSSEEKVKLIHVFGWSHNYAKEYSRPKIWKQKGICFPCCPEIDLFCGGRPWKRSRQIDTKAFSYYCGFRFGIQMSNSSRWKRKTATLLSKQHTLLNIEVCESFVWSDTIINSKSDINQSKEASSDKVSLSLLISFRTRCFSRRFWLQPQKCLHYIVIY